MPSLLGALAAALAVALLLPAAAQARPDNTGGSPAGETPVQGDFSDDDGDDDSRDRKKDSGDREEDERSDDDDDDASAPRGPVRRGVFPIRGSYNFGESGARFGTGRGGGRGGGGGGRRHQGQDIFAACGTKLVAAASGVVKFSKSQSAAGNYLVIDSGSYDHAYMHLQEPSPLKVGDRVRAGQPIGEVGRTGNASACHLHFELWTGDWQQGGNAVDPLPFLRAWARR